MSLPVHIVDWRRDFIHALGRFLLDSGRDPRQILVVFPHKRPARYLREFYRTSPDVRHPCFLPECMSSEDFIDRLLGFVRPEPLRRAERLDQVALLLDIVTDLQKLDDKGLGPLPREPKRFLPWGFRLATLFEELLRQRLTPRNLAYLEGELAPWAAALLGRVGDIFTSYLAKLDANGWTTPGLDARRTADSLDEIAPHLKRKGLHVVCAGFYALNGVEEAIFKRLQNEGRLDLLWHADPSLSTGGRVHPCEQEHQAWMKRWGLHADLLPAEDGKKNEKFASNAGPDISFVEGFDLHSQLAALERELLTLPTGTSCAVILPDASALTPVLYHLPFAEVNVSMGYPLARTALAHLLEIVLRLQENRDTRGLYAWRDLVALLRHPWVRLLAAGTSSALPATSGMPTENESVPVPTLFHTWEAAVRSGGIFQDPTEWAPAWNEPPLNDIPDPDGAEALRQEILTTCLHSFEDIHGLSDLARALNGLAEMLVRRGSALWHANLIDAEYLSRLRGSILPQLASGALADRPLPASSCFAILRQLAQDERVSFEPDPLLGLQVLGMLETRLLRFDTVMILDAEEERLPGGSPFDPLLPDPLRPLLGLPDSRERDAVAAYNFQRLLMGSRRAVIYWQDGVRPGLFDDKSARSRFVEELLWKREKRLGRLLTPDDDSSFTAVRFRAGSMPGSNAVPLPRTPILNQRVREKLAQGVSLSALDDYLRCPKRFYFSQLAQLRTMNQVKESGDRSEFGSAMHSALEAFATPYLGRLVDPVKLDATALFALFEKKLRETTFFRQMPFDRRTGLLASGRHRLKKFLAAQQPTIIQSLEMPLQAERTVQGIPVRIKGQFDRLDKRDAGLLILDYKTGTLPHRKGTFLDDEDVLDAVLYPPDPSHDGDPECLANVRESTGGVQLPGYLWMYWQATGCCAADAAWVDLKNDGEEKPLLGKVFDPEQRRNVVLKQAPALLDFVLHHLLTAPVFAAPVDAGAPRGPCRYCDFNGPCGAQSPL